MSNQFNDVFTLSEWHLYGSSRLGIQKPKHNVTLSVSEESAPYGDATGYFDNIHSRHASKGEPHQS
ncbi:MAG: hypothetical protein IT247_06005 [Bacteroidia bacterium]|nr:hypothetical protein [Bacteroidia bacterium]